MFFSVYWRKFREWADKGLKFLAFFVIGFYRIIVRGLLGGGGGCRFYPSCGDYALQVYGRFSFFEATKRLLRRLFSCHPFGPAGFFLEPFSEAGIRQAPYATRRSRAGGNPAYDDGGSVEEETTSFRGITNRVRAFSIGFKFLLFKILMFLRKAGKRMIAFLRGF